MNNLPRRKNRSKFSVFLLCSCCCCVGIVLPLLGTRRWRFFVIHSKTVETRKDDDAKHAEIAVYDLCDGCRIPDHLDLVDPTERLKPHAPRPFVSIDAAHREALYHFGNWLHVVDASNRLLLLKRKEHLVTCPGGWGLLGEHRWRDERVTETTIRAIREELGPDLLRGVHRVSNLTHDPVFYHRKYGRSLDNRVDNQLTYMNFVQLNVTVEKNSPLIRVDDEVADWGFFPMGAVEDWMKNDPGAFCHETIRSLLRLGLGRLKILLSEMNV